MKLHLYICFLSISLAFCKFHLPPTSKPNHYELFLFIDVDGGVFNGSVKINLDVTEPTDRISLNYRDINIHTDDVSLKSETFNYILSNTVFNASAEIVEFVFAPLSAGTYDFYTSFEGSIRNDLKGLYMSYYWTEDGQKHQAATTFLASIYARMIFPCYDEPRFKATFTVSMTHSDKYHALSNASPVTTPEIVAPGWLQTNFQPTPRMSVYLLAFIVSDFVGNTNSANNFTIYAQPEQVYMTNYSLSIGQQSLRKLEEYFEAPYQMSKMDMVAFDDFLMGAMENWGLITYLSSRLLYDEATVTTRALQQITKTITHEFVHQWFGNEVTAEWWSEIWLNEGFATFYEDLITDQIYPDWQLMDQFVVHTLQNAMGRDATLSAKSMDGSIETLEDIWGVYTYIPYQKAASVIRMIYNIVSDDVFKRAIKSYVKAMSYSSSVPQNLYDHLTAHVDDIPVQRIFESWVQNPGYPLVTVTRDYDNNLVHVAQKRFIASESLDVPETRYYVPINYATAKNSDFTNTKAQHFMLPAISAIDIPLLEEDNLDNSQWLIVNKKATYYYRVNYDNENWRLITVSLNDKPTTIATANRAQLLDDSFTLANYGHLSYDIALSLVNYLRKETEFIPVTVAIKHLRPLELILRGTDIPFRKFLQEIVSDIFNRVTLKEERSDPHLQKLLRSEVSKFACELEVKECVSKSVVDINLGHIIPNTRPAVYCGYLKESNETSWPLEIFTSKLVQYTQSEGSRRKHSQELGEIISSLSCVNSQSLRSSILEMTLEKDTEINFLPGDYDNIFSAIILSEKHAVTDGLEFLDKYYDRMELQYESMSRIFQTLGHHVKTEEELTLLKNIVRDKVDSNQSVAPGLRNSAQLAIVKGEENIAWLNKYSPAIAEWIKQHNSASSLMKSSMALIGSILLIVGHKILSGF